MLGRSSKEEEEERNGTERNGGKVNFHPFFHLPRFPRGTRLQTTELIIAFKLLPPIHSCASAFHRIAAEQRNNCFSLSPFASPPFFPRPPFDPIPDPPDFSFSSPPPLPAFSFDKISGDRRGAMRSVPRITSITFDYFQFVGTEMERVNPNS